MDGTKERGDSPEVTQDTSGETKGTSEQPGTFTKDQRDKAVSDALSAAGRDAKSIAVKSTEADRLVKEARQMVADIEVERKRQDEAELEAHRDNPEELTSIRKRHGDRDYESELDRREQKLDDKEAEHKEALAESAKSKLERDALEIATKHDVDVQDLIRFTDGSTGAMEELARKLPKKGDTARGKDPLDLDTGRTKGGELTEEQKLKERYPTM